MMTDSHIHIGQYLTNYTTAADLITFLDSVGIDKIAVSSTTTCEEDYAGILCEFKELLRVAGNRAYPVLWITPKMISSWAVFPMFDQGIEWECLKIHPQLHPTEWLEGSALMSLVAAIASIKGLPLLIHTGEMSGCYPCQHEWIIKARPDVTFILAHGRPIDQTIELMRTYSNVWCDTAFMPTENIVKLCKEGLTDRVLWGSDYPIPKYHYPGTDMKKYYLGLVNELQSRIDEESFRKITEQNFSKIFR